MINTRQKVYSLEHILPNLSGLPWPQCRLVRGRSFSFSPHVSYSKPKREYDRGYSPDLISATCQGHEFVITSSTPIILSGLFWIEGFIAGIPHATAEKIRNVHVHIWYRLDKYILPHTDIIPMSIYGDRVWPRPLQKLGLLDYYCSKQNCYGKFIFNKFQKTCTNIQNDLSSLKYASCVYFVIVATQFLRY